MASRSLQVFSTGIEVAGQNIANAGTPGYIREELLLEPNFPYSDGQLVFGTGVRALGIQQQIDVFLETRVHTANSDASAAAARDSIFRQLQSEIGELGDSDISTAVNDFLATLNDLANQPESAALREVVVREGQQLASELSLLRANLDELRQAQTVKVDTLVSESNRLITQIEELNLEITRAESAGLSISDAGALRSQRYQALNRLSEIIPIEYRENDNGSIDLFSGDSYVILTGQSQRLKSVPRSAGTVIVQDVVFTKTESPVSLAGGELAGVLDGRDNVIGGFINDLDQFASSLIFEFNRIHASGESQKGFTDVTALSAVDNSNSVLNNAGLNFAPTDGRFLVKVANTLTGLTDTTNIRVDLDGIDPGNDTTLESLRQDLDAVSNLNAVITPDGRLQLTTDAGFEVRFSEDTSGALASLGINTFFTGTDSDDIGVNSIVLNDSAFIASGQGGGPGDNRNLLLLAQFLDNPQQSLNGQSLDGFYNTAISRVAQSAAAESAVANGYAAFRDSLLNQRSQFSGVSLDEEAVHIIEFQQSFQAAARLIRVIDELYDVLLNI
ncbi:MAG: flagellar hook-associated protein FlgK [Planctomycetaceae bacterium]|nr:flagellar hook-associated protein FlgK [Planctomycetaceae bacterium]MBT6155110.1 flagellar hook-associated protein FlgK [Planctomycetaceae bacterium]MBT6483374.1 flagellar hook-associated protein FlgK [Planctomycetaceae bacterium]MBT6493831.1 flagellar hook-associated protein FlgK [Planctomycetaceae bacterium]